MQSCRRRWSTNEARTRAAARALGALPESEAEAFDRAAARDPMLAGVLSKYRATLTALEHGLPRVAPPPYRLRRLQAVAAAARRETTQL